MSRLQADPAFAGQGYESYVTLVLFVKPFAELFFWRPFKASERSARSFQRPWAAQHRRAQSGCQPLFQNRPSGHIGPFRDLGLLFRSVLGDAYGGCRSATNGEYTSRPQKGIAARHFSLAGIAGEPKHEQQSTDSKSFRESGGLIRGRRKTVPAVLQSPRARPATGREPPDMPGALARECVPRGLQRYRHRGWGPPVAR